MTDDERDARLETLIDLAADTNRRLAALTTETASNTAAIGLLTKDIASLTRVMRLRLIHDHGYEPPDDELPPSE